jgi:hypothetical protein
MEGQYSGVADTQQIAAYRPHLRNPRALDVVRLLAHNCVVSAPKIQQSGTSTTISFGWLQPKFVLQAGVLKGGRWSYTLSEYQYAGLARVPVPVRTKGGTEIGERRSWRLLFWRDSKTFDQFAMRPRTMSRNALRDDPKGLAASPWGQLATLLDSAIASAATEPPPDKTIGLYLARGGDAVWIPRLGSWIA